MVRPKKAVRPRKRKSNTGRPAFTPRADQRRVVEIMAGLAVNQESIAKALGISSPTLNKHFRNELAQGAGVVERMLTTRLMAHVKSKRSRTSLDAIKFALRTRFGWTERFELSGALRVDPIPEDDWQKMRRAILELEYPKAEPQVIPRPALPAPKARVPHDVTDVDSSDDKD
jgi:AcrR family transcriptional regulator